jgi:hypothetical protein
VPWLWEEGAALETDRTTELRDLAAALVASSPPWSEARWRRINATVGKRTAEPTDAEPAPKGGAAA